MTSSVELLTIFFRQCVHKKAMCAIALFACVSASHMKPNVWWSSRKWEFHPKPHTRTVLESLTSHGSCCTNPSDNVYLIKVPMVKQSRKLLSYRYQLFVPFPITGFISLIPFPIKLMLIAQL